MTASVRDSAASSSPVVTAPALLLAVATPAGSAAPQFEASLYVTANSLNLRKSSSTLARVLGSLSRNTAACVGERWGGWVNISVDGMVGWVSGDYLGADPVVATPRAAQRLAQVYIAPVPNQLRQPVAQRGSNVSCPQRQYCMRIGSCEEARCYLVNCS
ncbi:MAG: SH3 domain-containing protein [Candidatus Devosia symbiotica]|nr:SH3 domain-containing protein [Candidatus Devosia symbiotica]